MWRQLEVTISARPHWAEIRAALGFREPTVGDEDKLRGLAEEVCAVEPSEERLREALLASLRFEAMRDAVRRCEIYLAVAARWVFPSLTFSTSHLAPGVPDPRRRPTRNAQRGWVGQPWCGRCEPVILVSPQVQGVIRTCHLSTAMTMSS